ncbi:hypothetical protein [Pontivivens ytuae]|uniref:Penicillin-insensitive murein endopeptidase n=1 Tax=Pontivivens ytuae TaxID=2789856 RepID=A0A7S9QEF4_9RHOB|nr:hypothetical protein [Pontivivens ytuae]QPH55131.1 hypothetical protein I0K15_05125 [Pontivivens ytuae]
MFLIHVAFALVLTAATQVGGVAWLAGLIARGTGPARVLRHAAWFLGFYFGLSVLAWSAAAGFGRVPLPCGDGPVAVQPRALCAMNRHYAAPEVRDLLVAMAEGSGQPIRVLDAGFPLFDGFPLLPHLSHRDGHSVDLALAYEGVEGSPSPFGYWAFAGPRPGEPQPCAGGGGALRWDMDWLQGAIPDRPLDEAAQRDMLAWLAEEGPEHGLRRVLVEPHLPVRLGVESPLFRFQGCGAARHDDHLHLDIR